MFAIDTCLPDGFFSKPHIYHFAHQIFTKLAFARPECGDCLIAALVNSSGSRGLSAFLPSEEQLYYPEDTKKGKWERTEPMLPLTDRWADANFTISNNVRKGQDLWDGVEVREDGAVRLREWCVKLLSRYAYSYGMHSIISRSLCTVIDLQSRLDCVEIHPDPLRSGTDQRAQAY
jgi:3-O-alpha-D-mannopyranosyl-alpha-D-mannopyranose xylosylphosphotransferase